METNIIELSQSLKISQKQIEKVLQLTAEGNKIPFIARYRKEMTGNLDEVEIKAILDLDKSLTNLRE
ncbi:Tex-like N-terminal domain-containing protein, partial [Streptococcus sp. UMB1203]|uniref:Tex-like N-terminal domain-containing protein n=1 Tax=Streptococcus sp. UMB1203 TaxID=3046327 RepID=UPI0025547823